MAAKQCDFTGNIAIHTVFVDVIQRSEAPAAQYLKLFKPDVLIVW